MSLSEAIFLNVLLAVFMWLNVWHSFTVELELKRTIEPGIIQYTIAEKHAFGWPFVIYEHAQEHQTFYVRVGESDADVRNAAALAMKRYGNQELAYIFPTISMNGHFMLAFLIANILMLSIVLIITHFLWRYFLGPSITSK